jgi:phage tail-like protein
MGAGNYLNNGIFKVSVQKTEMSFSKVTGISDDTDYDVYVEGGGQMHFLPKPPTTSGKITFEKGVSTIENEKKFAGIFCPGTEIHDIAIDIVKNNKVVESYFITDGMVVSWELGDLDAIHPGVAIKKFTIAHAGVQMS